MSRRRKLLLTLSLGGAAVIVLHTFLSPDGYTRRARARGDLAAIEAEIAAGEERAARLRSQIEALRTRPDVQERAVRDELGYVRPGDLVFDAAASTPAKR